MFAHDNISTPIPFNVIVSDEVALAEGDEAADRIISGATLIDHLKVGRALMVGARIAAKEAGTHQGKPYNIAFNKWLQRHPKLAAVNEQNRAAALWCLNEQNWPRVEKYLGTLDIEERQTISLRTVRRRLDVPPPRPAAPKHQPQATAAAAHKAATSPTDRTREAADQAEIATLKAEVWRLRDKLDQLAMFLVEKPPLKAENRPTATRVWPLPETLERRPKDVPEKRIVNPDANDPDFALRKEEFEQWLVRRKEALEARYAEKDAERKKAFDAKVRERVEVRMAKEDANGRVFTEAQFMNVWRCLHSDSRNSLSDKALDRAFMLFNGARKRLVYEFDAKGKKVAAEPPVVPDPAPEPPQDGGPSAKALS